MLLVTPNIFMWLYIHCELCVVKQAPKEYCIEMIYEGNGIHHSDIYTFSLPWTRGHNFATVSNISPCRILTFHLRHCYPQPMCNCFNIGVRCSACQHWASTLLKWYHYSKINSPSLEGMSAFPLCCILFTFVCHEMSRRCWAGLLLYEASGERERCCCLLLHCAHTFASHTVGYFCFLFSFFCFCLFVFADGA